jgi:hypothetical protein
MDELDAISACVKGGLLTKEDAKITTSLLFMITNSDKPVFSDEELFKIYFDVKCRSNSAPEENLEFEDKLSNSIIKKLESYVKEQNICTNK